jgi:hypothetical protein
MWRLIRLCCYSLCKFRSSFVSMFSTEITSQTHMISWKTGIGFPDRAWIFLVTGPEISSGIQPTSNVVHDRAVGRIRLVSRLTSSVKFINVCSFAYNDSHVFIPLQKKQQFKMPPYHLGMTTFLHIFGITICLGCLNILNTKSQKSSLVV